MTEHLDARETRSRFAKYFFLFVWLAITTTLVFNAFSLYIARRDLDKIFEGTQQTSFEQLLIDDQNRKYIDLATLETRCKERLQLAAFRLLQFDDADALTFAYDKLYDAKAAIIRTAADSRLINTDKFVKYVYSVEFDFRLIHSFIEPLQGTDVSSAEYAALMQSINVAVNNYRQVGESLSEIRKRLSDSQVSQIIFDNLGIGALETRLSRLDPPKESTTPSVDDLAKKKALALITVWTQAMAGLTKTDPRVSELAFSGGQFDSDIKLRDLDCRAFDQFFVAVTGIDLHLTPSSGFFSRLIDAPAATGRAYRRWLVDFFQLPPVAQTLFVTLFMGMLGALGLNVLRLSKIGWWEKQPDPGWGEIVLSPFLGSLAALGVFLLASTGLLLTSSGAAVEAPLSPFFIGLLGFISGLLYDEAFGQVRRFGSRYFGQDGTTAGGQAGDDEELSRAIATETTTLVARLAAVSHLGTRLSQATGFTLFVPPDPSIPRELIETAAKATSGASMLDIEKWFDDHLVDQRLSAAELAKLAGSATSSLVTRSGKRRAITLAGVETRVAGALVAKADTAWRKGIIHVLGADFS